MASCGVDVCGLSVSVSDPGPYTCDQLKIWADVVTEYSPPKDDIALRVTHEMPGNINGMQDGGSLVVRPVGSGICQTAAIHEYLHYVHDDPGHQMGHVWGTTEEFTGDGTEQRLRILCDSR